MACAETWISIRKETGVAAFCSSASLQLQADFVCNQTKVTWGHCFPATILVWETGTAAITGKCDVDNLSILGIRRESNAFSGLQSSTSGERRILMCSELGFCIKAVLSNLGMAMRCFSVQELSRVICTLLGPDQRCLGRKGIMEKEAPDHPSRVLQQRAVQMRMALQERQVTPFGEMSTM